MAFVAFPWRRLCLGTDLITTATIVMMMSDRMKFASINTGFVQISKSYFYHPLH